MQRILADDLNLQPYSTLPTYSHLPGRVEVTDFENSNSDYWLKQALYMARLIFAPDMSKVIVSGYCVDNDVALDREIGQSLHITLCDDDGNVHNSMFVQSFGCCATICITATAGFIAQHLRKDPIEAAVKAWLAAMELPEDMPTAVEATLKANGAFELSILPAIS